MVATPGGAQVPLAQLADIRIEPGPPMIKSENARKTAWIYVDLTTSDIGGWVERAKRLVSERVNIPAGYNLVWSGQYEYIEAANRRLAIAIPFVFVGIVRLLYLSHRSWLDTCIVLLAVVHLLRPALDILVRPALNKRGVSYRTRCCVSVAASSARRSIVSSSNRTRSPACVRPKLARCRGITSLRWSFRHCWQRHRRSAGKGPLPWPTAAGFASARS
ncbi:MAG: efflux RND transporter permease subunit [Phycisphaerales bacterium]|nr:efflux RND transporter permease subunit [Phycisphaerales bacterium]